MKAHFQPLQIILLLLLGFAASCSGQQQQKKTQTTNQTNKTMKTLIVDVRTQGEWQMDGHADCSVNIPLDQLENNLDKVKGYEKVVLVCRSGARAGNAKRMLEQAGISNVENLGPWQNVNCN